MPLISPFYPFLGSILATLKVIKENPNTNEHPWNLLLKKFFHDDYPKAYLTGSAGMLNIFVLDPDMCQDLFLNKNKYLDKTESA